MDAPQSPEYKAADEKLGQLLNRANEIAEEVKAGKAETAEVKQEMANMKSALNEAHEEREAARAKAEADELVDWLKDFQAEQNKAPSKAAMIGSRPEKSDSPENFFGLVAKTKSKDYREAQQAQDTLNAAGLGWRAMPSDSHAAKATLGTSDAAGGYLIPNNLVSTLIEHASNRNPYRQMMNVITGVRGDAVDQPTEGLTPTRATVQAWGATKSNTDLTVANYTATLYTLAHILDVANQFLRHSEGAAEQLVRSTLAR